MNVNTHFAISLIISEVRTLADQNPDFQYWPQENSLYSNYIGCKYTADYQGKKSTSDNECGCIIGRAILKHFPSLRKTLEYFDNRTESSGISIVLQEIGWIENVTDEVSWLQDVQQYQDSGNTWRWAVTLADENFHESI